MTAKYVQAMFVGALLLGSCGCRTVTGLLIDTVFDRDRSVRGPVDEPGISARERRARLEDDRLRELTSNPSWNSGPSSWNSD